MPNRILQSSAIAAAPITAMEPPFAFAFARYATTNPLFMRGLLQGSVAVVLAGAICAVVASRGAAARLLLIAAACEAFVGLEAWLVLRHFWHIAVYGGA